MAYVNPNFRTKKALKEAVKHGDRISVFSPGPFGCRTEGAEFIEGPHYPEAHKVDRCHTKIGLQTNYLMQSM